MNERSPDGVTGRLTVLTEEKCRAIYDAALTVIAEVGMTVPHKTARRLLLDAGATVEGEDLVHLPRALVARARGTAAEDPRLRPRRELAMQLGGFNAYFGTGSDLMNTYDLETGERRPSVLPTSVAWRASATPCRTSTSSCRAPTRATSPAMRRTSELPARPATPPSRSS